MNSIKDFKIEDKPNHQLELKLEMFLINYTESHVNQVLKPLQYILIDKFKKQYYNMKEIQFLVLFLLMLLYF